MNQSIHELYAKYWSSPAFQGVYRGQRDRIYRKMFAIAAELDVKTVLDVGCAYGQFVDQCNKASMDAWGVDLPMDELVRHHDTLERSRGRFFHGSIEEPELGAKLAALRHWDLVTCIETLRHLDGPECLLRLRAKYYLIKEGCNNWRVRRRRRDAHDLRLWSPCDLASEFPGYMVKRIYLPRFLAKWEKPPRWGMRALNATLPNYTLLLQRMADD